MWEHLELGHEVTDELEQLVQQYGEPLISVVHLGSASGRFGPRIREKTLQTRGSFAPIGKPDRYAEVCMVVRRPNGSLLTARKAYYPADCYRLLTGGIGHGEQIKDALLRETWEETNLQVDIRRFLAAATYLPADRRVAPFHTFAFLVDERAGNLQSNDPEEDVADFRMIESHELPQLAQRLEQLGEQHHSTIEGLWSDWGRFRAVVHRLVAEALN